MQHGPRSIVQCELLDLSLGGMAVLSQTPLVPRQRTRVESSFRGTALVLDAMVVRRKRTREGYVLGLKFVQLSDVARRGLEEVLRTMQMRSALARQACVFFDRLPRLEVPAHASSVPIAPHPRPPSGPVPAAPPAGAASVPPAQASVPTIPSAAEASVPSIPPHPTHPSVPTIPSAAQSSVPSRPASGSIPPRPGHPAHGSVPRPPSYPGHGSVPPAAPARPAHGSVPSATPPDPNLAHASVPSGRSSPQPNGSHPPWAVTGPHPAVATYGMTPTQRPAAAPPPHDSAPHWDRTMITPMPEVPGSPSDAPLGAESWTDDELQTRLAPSAVTRAEPAPSRPSAPWDGELASRPGLDGDAWTDDELRTRLAPSAATRAEPAPTGPPLNEGSWTDDELQTRLAPSAATRAEPTPRGPTLGEESWTDDELSTNHFSEDARRALLESVPTPRMNPRTDPRMDPRTDPRMDQIDSGMPILADGPSRPEPDAPRMADAGTPRVHASPRGYLDHADPFDPFAPIPDRGNVEVGLPSVDDDEAPFGFEAVEGLYEASPPHDEPSRPRMPRAPRSPSGPLDDTSELEDADSTRARLELGEQLARMISSQLVEDALETDDATVASEGLPDVDRTAVEPSSDTGTVPEMGVAAWQLESLDRTEHEETSVDRWPTPTEDEDDEDVGLALDPVPLPEEQPLAVPEVVEEDHTHVALHVPMPPLEQLAEELAAPVEPVTGFTMVMHIDDVVAAAELQASEQAAVPEALPAPAENRSGNTVQIDLRDGGLSWSADPAASPAEATWEPAPAPEPAEPETRSVHDEPLPVELDLGPEAPGPAPAPVVDESSLPRLSNDLQAALGQLRKRDGARAEAETDEGAETPSEEPRKSRRRQRRDRVSRRWAKDSPELVELYRAALAQLDHED